MSLTIVSPYVHDNIPITLKFQWLFKFVIVDYFEAKRKTEHVLVTLTLKNKANDVRKHQAIDK